MGSLPSECLLGDHLSGDVSEGLARRPYIQLVGR